MKRKLPQVLAMLICLSLVGCASSSETAQPDEPNTSDQTVADQLSSETAPTGTEDGISDDGPGVELSSHLGMLKMLYNLAYSENENVSSSSFEEHLAKELDLLVELTEPVGLQLPDNYVDDYTNWRIETYGLSFIQTTAPSAEPAPQDDYTFSDCNDTIYATGSVNLRSGPGTSYDKVGSLSAGQSVTRTGIGTGSAEGWSRVQLDDSNIVYVNNNYISTSKPVPKQNATTSSTTNQGTTQASGILDDRGIGGANGFTDDMFVHNEDLYPGMTEEEIQQAVRDINNQSEFRIQGAT